MHITKPCTGSGNLYRLPVVDELEALGISRKDILLAFYEEPVA